MKLILGVVTAALMAAALGTGVLAQFSGADQAKAAGNQSPLEVTAAEHAMAEALRKH